MVLERRWPQTNIQRRHNDLVPKSFLSDNQKQTAGSQPAYEQSDPHEETEGRRRLTQPSLKGSNVARSRVRTESEQHWGRLVGPSVLRQPGT